MQYLDAISKTTEWSLFISKANHSISQLSKSIPTSNAKEAEVERFYEDLQDLLELTPKKDILFITGDWNRKVENQEISRVSGKFGIEAQMKQGKGYQSFAREYTGCSKQPFPTTQEMTLHMDITRWPIPKSNWLHSLQLKMEKLYKVSKNKNGSWLWLRSWTPCFKIQT